MDKMNYYYGMNNIENANCCKKVKSLKFKRKMVKRESSSHLIIKNSLKRK